MVGLEGDATRTGFDGLIAAAASGIANGQPSPGISGLRIALDRDSAEVLEPRDVPAVIVLEDSSREGHAGGVGCDPFGFIHGGPRARPRLPRRHAAVVAAYGPGIGERGMCVGEIRIDFD